MKRVPDRRHHGPKVRTYLELSVHAALGISMVYLVLVRVVNRDTSGVDEIQVGQTVAGMNPHMVEETERTFLAAVSPSCQYCIDSMPFYQTLSVVAATHGSGMVAAVGTSDHIALQEALFAEAGVGVDTIIVLDFQEAGIPGVPLVLELDRSFNVRRKWVGALNALRGAEVLAAASGRLKGERVGR